jgi:hypothetical protein
MEDNPCNCQVLDAWMTDTGRVHIELECDVTKQQESDTEIEIPEVTTEIPAEAETPEQGPAEEALEE